ncbi:adenine-specific DNA-methyltransferase [Salegentibacter sp. 24]|nr:adenine-specific DNA-methyltransferase [Salegentibacter sp. 24]
MLRLHHPTPRSQFNLEYETCYMSVEKLDLASPDLVNENIEKIAALLPNCVTESADGKAIDFDLLKQELSYSIVEGNKERYRLEWPGKREAIVTANLPTTKTLRPVREDSVDFDNTENLYIEGDNLEVLKLLQESYLGKIKMIYIDPPYNTGSDFVYKDNFSKKVKEELVESGQKDESNLRLVANPETSGRYHSDWLSMIYPRLKLARNLLANDGVIFISIDEHEIHNLKRICDEIFGDINSIENLIWTKNTSKNDSKEYATTHEYILCYAKNKQFRRESRLGFRVPKPGYKEVMALQQKWNNSKPTLEKAQEELKSFYKSNKKFKGISQYKHVEIKNNEFLVFREDNAAWPQGTGPMYDIIHPITKKICNKPARGWRWKEETMESLLEQDLIVFGKDENKTPQFKRHLYKMSTDVQKSHIVNNDNGENEVRQIFESTSSYIEHPKPTSLLQEILGGVEVLDDQENIILDFFSGSASTAQSTINLNSIDNGRRRFILVQLPELTDKNSDAYKAGYKNICEIGEERIRRAGKKIKEETGADLDYGFRVYRLDDSNMQDVYYKPQEYLQDNLELFADNVKPDRTADDLLAQVMVDWGLPLSLKIEREEISGKEVFKVAGNSLYACFDEGVDEEFAKAIADDAPLRVVFKDSGFKDDTAKTNVKQLLKQLSPETEMKVI